MILLLWDSLPNFRYNAVIVYNFSIKSKLIFISKTKKSAICLPNIHQINTHHFIVLQPLLKDVWAGDYSLLKPLTFKECLSNTHPQFSGSHQHDCQEVLRRRLVPVLHARPERGLDDLQGGDARTGQEVGPPVQRLS